MKLSREDFDNIEFMRECVVEIASVRANEIRFNGGTLLLTGWEQETDGKQATRYGKLVKMPKSTQLVFGNMFACELDAQGGDMVWVDAWHVAQELSKNRGEDGIESKLIYVDDKLYIRLPSIALNCAKREDELIALNGYCIVEIIPEEDTETESGLWIPAQKKSTTRARVVASPKSLPVYRDAEKFSNTLTKAGDVIHAEDHYFIPLDGTYRSETTLHRILSSMILAIE